MHHAITGYFQNDAKHWVARLDCGHDVELQHNPPVANNPWVLTQTGRDDKIGVILICKKCISGEQPDQPNQLKRSQTAFSALLDKQAA